MDHDIEGTAKTLVADGKGILAADETPDTLTRRFDALGIRSTEESWGAYREMLFTAPDAANFISGVIMQDGTINQQSSRGKPLALVLASRGIVTGWDALRPHAIGHRVVYGGAAHDAPEPVTPRLLAELRTLVPLAPLHLPAALAGIDTVSALFPWLPQVACFDTAFHRGMPAVAHRLPLPRALAARGIQRYGFHGLSYEYVLAALGAATLGRAVIAHLGNGASLAAVRDGRPVDTTMGFSPAGGLMMGTRSGDLDPGVLVHLLAHEGYDASSIEHLVDRESGLLGVSGTTSHMKALFEARDRSARRRGGRALLPRATQAHRGARCRPGRDRHARLHGRGRPARAAPVRDETCRGLEHLGIRIDRARNDRNETIISKLQTREAR